MIYNKTREVGKKEILQGWRRFLKSYKPTPLTSEEKLTMDRMMLACKHSRGIRFIPGEEVKEMGASATRQPLFICKKWEME